MSNTPPGWYPAPDRPGERRWWNGSGWSDYYDPATSPVQQEGYVPAQPKRSRLGLILGLAGGLVVVIVVGLVVVGLLLSGLLAGATNTAGSNDKPASSAEPSESSTPDPEESDADSGLAEWDALKDRYDDEYAKYKAAISSGEMYDYVPDTDKGREYYTAFLYILIDHKSALTFVELGIDDMNPAELDSTIDEYETKLDELLDTFLANEDLDADIKITRSDGTVFESDGSAP